MPHYGVREDQLNTLLHGIGALLSFIGLILLVTASMKQGAVAKTIIFAVYGVAAVLMYSASTIYHMSQDFEKRQLFRYLDHVAISLMIAGTYTPMSLLAVKGVWGWTIFSLVWFLALAGILYEILFLGRYKWISIAIYIAMGWVVVVAFKPFVEAVTDDFFWWMMAGGIAYTAGIPFYLIKKVPYFHAIWHAFVLAGTLFHFIGFYFYL